ncbi:hypothetical protein BDR26DRAFT_850588 [Obelidium mucronatum]|nr:hypothetical protein BDR26DRAFT_850588 [Obelidium mucronatum]
MSSVKPIAIKASLSTKTTRGLSQGGGSYRGRTISLKKMTQAGRSAASPSSSAESSSFASNSVAPVLLDSESPSAVIPAPSQDRSQEEQEQNQAQNAGGNNSTLNEMAVDSESAPLLPTSPIDIVPAAEGIAETDRPVWVAPPPQHSRADREASYRFGGMYIIQLYEALIHALLSSLRCMEAWLFVWLLRRHGVNDWLLKSPELYSGCIHDAIFDCNRQHDCPRDAALDCFCALGCISSRQLSSHQSDASSFKPCLENENPCTNGFCVFWNCGI